MVNLYDLFVTCTSISSTDALIAEALLASFLWLFEHVLNADTPLTCISSKEMPILHTLPLQGKGHHHT